LLAGERVKRIEHIPWTAPENRKPPEELIPLFCGVASLGEMHMAKMPVASRTDPGRVGDGLYDAEFFRDAYRMAKPVLSIFPQVAVATVLRSAELQGLLNAPGSDTEERGETPHEMRDITTDKIAQEFAAKFGWTFPYFGSVDATPQQIEMAATLELMPETAGLFEQSVVQRDGVQRTIAESFGMSLEWLVRKLGENPEGLIEVGPASNDCWQVWADSPDAYYHSDGRLARGRVAAIEVQAWAYDALRKAAELFDSKPLLIERCGGFSPNQLAQMADKLESSVRDNFWVNDRARGGYFAYATERHEGVLAPLKVRSANMGLVLSTQMFRGKSDQWRIDSVVNHLMNPDMGMNTPQGVLNVGRDSPRFRHPAYHNGQPWSWVNYDIANGLDSRGYLGLGTVARRATDRASDELNCSPEKHQAWGAKAQMNEARVWLISPDGHGGTFEHQAMQPGQVYQGWTAFGQYAGQVVERNKSIGRQQSGMESRSEFETNLLGRLDRTFAQAAPQLFRGLEVSNSTGRGLIRVMDPAQAPGDGTLGRSGPGLALGGPGN
jgi:hypothetical protein